MFFGRNRFITLICPLVILLLPYLSNAQKKETKAKLVTQNQCGSRILRAKGHTDKSFAKQVQVVFDDDHISISPERPSIPGCFNLTAKRVKITGELKTLTMEFEMRIGDVPDPKEKPLPCKKVDSECGCGSKDSCMYCDFCRNMKRHFSKVTVKNSRTRSRARTLDMARGKSEDRCICSFGTKDKTIEYDLTAEVCTPSGDELEDFLPEKVLAQVDSGSKARAGSTRQQFTLFTTINMYNLRFQNLNRLFSRTKYLDKLKKDALIGCHLIGTNVDVKKRG